MGQQFQETAAEPCSHLMSFLGYQWEAVISGMAREQQAASVEVLCLCGLDGAAKAT